MVFNVVGAAVIAVMALITGTMVFLVIDSRRNDRRLEQMRRDADERRDQKSAAWAAWDFVRQDKTTNEGGEIK